MLKGGEGVEKKKKKESQVGGPEGPFPMNFEQYAVVQGLIQIINK